MPTRSNKRKKGGSPQDNVEPSTTHRPRLGTIDRQGLASAIDQLRTHYLAPVEARIHSEYKRLAIYRRDPQLFDRFGPLGHLKVLATGSDRSLELDKRVISQAWRELKGVSLTLWKRVRSSNINLTGLTSASGSKSVAVPVDDPFIRLAPPSESDPSSKSPSHHLTATGQYILANLLDAMERWSKSSQGSTNQSTGSQIDPWSSFISLGDSVRLQEEARAWASVKNLLQTLVNQPSPSDSSGALSNRRVALNDPSLIRFIGLILSDATLREWMETATIIVSNPLTLLGSSFHSIRGPLPSSKHVTLAPVCLIDTIDPDPGEPNRQADEGDAAQGVSGGFAKSSTDKVWKTFCASRMRHGARGARSWPQRQGGIDAGPEGAEHVIVLLAVRSRLKQQDGEEEVGGVCGDEEVAWQWCLVDCRWDSMANDIGPSRGGKRATIYGFHQGASDIEGVLVDFLNEMDAPEDESGKRQTWKMETIPLLSPNVYDGSSGSLTLVLLNLALSSASSIPGDRLITRSDLLHAIAVYKDYPDLGARPTSTAGTAADWADNRTDLAILSEKIILGYIVDLFNMRQGVLELWEACRSGWFIGTWGGQGHTGIVSA